MLKKKSQSNPSSLVGASLNSLVPAERVTRLREKTEGSLGQTGFVLYWMQMTKRVQHNFGLQYAIEKANELGLPVVVYEGLRYDYPWACDRIHSFIIEGARHTAEELKKRGIQYLFYLEKDKQSPKGVLLRLASQSAFVVTDDFPCFIIPGHNKILAEKVDTPSVAVDSNGIIPMKLFNKQEYAARTIRPKIYKLLPTHFKDWKLSQPKVKRSLDLPGPWTSLEKGQPEDLANECDIDHSVKSHKRFIGGRPAGLAALKKFLTTGKGYSDRRNNSGEGSQGTSGLSPYLHFGFISSLEVALAVKDSETLTMDDKNAYLEELIVRRELSYNFTLFKSDYEKIESLPNWAKLTLHDHQNLPRSHNYTLEQFENGLTHDDLWNASQLEMVKSGKMHGYMRMLWGKKIIEWTKTPEEALSTMIHLNNKYCLDGRNPNSYVGFLWCLGLHDRPWFPKRPGFGSVRYMSSDSTKKKLDWKSYLKFVSEL